MARATLGLATESRVRDMLKKTKHGNFSEREVTWGKEGTIGIGSTTSKATRDQNVMVKYGI